MQRGIVLLLLAFVPCLWASSFTPITNACNPTALWECIGYWEYLPNSYNNATSTVHPTIITLHGVGEFGSGSVTDLNKMLVTSLPKIIHDGRFPATWDFLVFAPQDFNGWWNFGRVDNVIVTLLSRYPKIDRTRIYLTGYSAGGGGVWAYSGNGVAQSLNLAAIAPICGTADIPPAAATINAMVQANLPVWAFHNNGDPTVTVGTTKAMISALNTAHISPVAQQTIYNVSGHDAWDATYDPATSPVYNWFLSHSRSATATPAPTHAPTPAPTPAPTHAPTPAPTPAPTCPPASIGTGSGLLGVYYSGMYFNHSLSARTDSTVNFIWASGTGLTGLPVTQYSVRWTGTVRAKFTGVHTFYTTADDGVTLTVNNNKIINKWQDQAPTEFTGQITLTAGQSYPIVMEMYNNGQGAEATLSWSAPCLNKEIIPASQLTPATLTIC